MEQKPTSDEGWKERGNEDNSYRARLVSHEANTSIEYGEKTWTTAQTVRDLMQNHLDAETERYFGDVAKAIFDEGELAQYLNSEGGNTPKKEVEKEKVENLLHRALLFAKHAEDMSPEARVESEKYLAKLAEGLKLSSRVMDGEVFSPARFLETIRPYNEEHPSVLYEIKDGDTGLSLGWVAYEALRDEPLYRDISRRSFRYQITGMKIVDHGSGFDSQLSTLYLSSKTGKKHLRGKFGEGAKMSELHLLRGGAKMKLRSTYSLMNKEGEEVNRTWQTRAGVKGGRLVSRGVELEQGGSRETGSMVSISLAAAKEEFREEFLGNVDPRLGGLEKNIADFGAQEFVYPMPITENHLSGVDISRGGETQYVQGLRVEIAGEQFGYSKPWFSYNFLDSGIIAGRDRNEINGDIQGRIREFWSRADKPDLLKQLVRVAVSGNAPGTEDMPNSAELSVLNEILSKDSDTKSPISDGVQKIVDEALVEELRLVPHQHTLIVPMVVHEQDISREGLAYARTLGYEIKTIKAPIAWYSLNNFTERLPAEYEVVTISDMQNKLNDRYGKENDSVPVEGKREEAIREVFAGAADSVNSLAIAAGMDPIRFNLELDMTEGVNERSDEEADRWAPSNNEELSPLTIFFGGVCHVRIRPDQVMDPFGDATALQKQIEGYLLSAFSNEDDEDDNVTAEEVLRKSQRVLDELITRLIPEDAAVLNAIPEHIAYAKDPAVLERIMGTIFGKSKMENEGKKEAYGWYLRAIDPELTFEEALKLLDPEGKDIHVELGDIHGVKNIIRSRVFLSDDVLNYYNRKTNKWEKLQTGKTNPTSRWKEFPVYELQDGRFFVPAPMGKGAVLTKGEGKKREYTFSEGNDFLKINEYRIHFEEYGWGGVSVHSAGITLPERDLKPGRGIQPMTPEEHIEDELLEYSYFPTGVSVHDGSIERGVSSTAIPVEYGQNEWDNPVRIFQDIVQNHIDASPDGRAELKYEVERAQRLSVTEEEILPGDRFAGTTESDDSGKVHYEVERGIHREWVEEKDMLSDDSIVGLAIKDNGDGYYPNDIATMGASSKKSPLFAGKYGEGQKMVAAATLRNGMELTYRSTLQKDDGTRAGWSAEAVSKPRKVVIGGKEVEKQLVAFDVIPVDAEASSGSQTILRLPTEILNAKGRGQWSEWISIIDPRKKDERGNGGLSRYVRQLRGAGSERVHSVGSISILLDEPGAVYENGLRINPGVEKGRPLAFGYDVPEVVSTRERNSYKTDRLKKYMEHSISNTTDSEVIEHILRVVAGGTSKKAPDLYIGEIMERGNSASSAWADIARKVWPGVLVHSRQKIEEDINGDPDDYSPRTHSVYEQRKIEKAQIIQANMWHLDQSKVLNVSKADYDGFSKLLPTAESVINKLETITLPVPAEVKKILSKVVSECTKIFLSLQKDAEKGIPADKLWRHHLSKERMLERAKEWSNDATIERNNAVAIAPISSLFHGKVDMGVVFNEALLFEGRRRDLAETALHEMAHVLSGERDYTEYFVEILADLAHYLARNKAVEEQMAEERIAA